ncbi:hypothetical protein INT47_000425 [Mucor saturninus]|uniref:Uncharacterized protein n=1 Tax=Mucor saturninus TaxID=64648 RepID=A0A8H7QNM6_9FUNG|nr:hypothetical protein INT47_000425 [Mucor saturninus]
MTFLSHSQLPQPVLFKNIDTSKEFSHILQPFLDAHSDAATRFTIDDDNVGRGLVCAFFKDPQIKGVMVYAKKHDIKAYMSQQGYPCGLGSSVTGMPYIDMV